MNGINMISQETEDRIIVQLIESCGARNLTAPTKGALIKKLHARVERAHKECGGEVSAVLCKVIVEIHERTGYPLEVILLHVRDYAMFGLRLTELGYPACVVNGELGHRGLSLKADKS